MLLLLLLLLLLFERAVIQTVEGQSKRATKKAPFDVHVCMSLEFAIARQTGGGLWSYDQNTNSTRRRESTRINVRACRAHPSVCRVRVNMRVLCACVRACVCL